MKSYLILLSLIFLTAITTSFVLAIPLESNKQNEDKALLRTRRDISGLFDSIANGFEGLVEGARKVSDSVFAAFNGVFSSTNKNSITDGFEKFGRGVKDAFNGFFGENGEKVKSGMKKVGNKIKGAWEGIKGKDGDDNAVPSDATKSSPGGSVPQEETT